MRLEALPEIALAVAGERTAEAVLGHIVRGLAKDPTVALARIWLRGPGDQCASCRFAPECRDRTTCLHLVASAGTPVAAVGEDWARTNGDFRRIPLRADAKISRVGTSGIPELLDDVASELARSQLLRPQWARAEKITTFAGQPLVFRGEILGMLGVFLRARLGEQSFTALRTFADQAAVSIANARAFDEVHALQGQLAAERDRLRVLLEVTSATGRELSLPGLFTAIAKTMRPVLPYDWTHLALFYPDEKLFRVHTLVTPDGHEKPNVEAMPLESPIGRAFTARRTLVLHTQEELLGIAVAPGQRARIQGFGAQAACMVPLVSRGVGLGVLAFGSLTARNFDPARVELVEKVAAQITPAIDNALAYERLEEMKEQLAKEKLYLEDEIRSERNFDELVGQSKALRQTLAGIETVAATSSTVLVLGETGTGKELVARAIHKLSGRGERTFVKLNCAAIPTGLLESELFGHEKGAFTGAVSAKAGRFELAHKGTLFLDEIGEISPELQPKLLRVLQDQEFERLGGTKTIKVDVRLIAATNRNLAQMVAARQFRSDLFYRLNVFPVSVPPLRERSGDVPLLVRFFVDRFARKMGKRIETIPAEMLAALEAHSWPGNVRELEHLVERAVILSRGSVLEVPLGELAVSAGTAAPPPPAAAAFTAPTPPPGSLLEKNERDLIVKTLEECGWRVGGAKGAAARLGLSRTTLQSKMLRLGIVRPG